MLLLLLYTGHGDPKHCPSRATEHMSTLTHGVATTACNSAYTQKQFDIASLKQGQDGGHILCPFGGDVLIMIN
jgi:hypothetical protein